MTAGDVLTVIRGARFLWSSEDDLQRGLAEALTVAGFVVEREVRLNGTDRIDLLVGRVGIEVKTAGAWKNVARQVDRYLRSDRIGDLILVTCKAQHRRIPEVLATTDPDRRLIVHQLVGSGL